jgi:hypothetical protein
LSVLSIKLLKSEGRSVRPQAILDFQAKCRVNRSRDGITAFTQLGLIKKTVNFDKWQ